MSRFPFVALIALVGCKFPYPGDVEDAASGDGDASGDGASVDASPADAPTDGTPRGPLVVNNQPADIVFGQADFTSNVDRGVVVNGMLYPRGLAVSGSLVWIGDVDPPRRVLAFPALPSGNDPNALLVLGRNNFTDSSATSPSATTMTGGIGIAATSDSLIVTDVGFNRVLIWRPIPSSNGEAADVVLGQVSFSASGSGSGANQMNLPTRVWTDGTRLVVVDSGNHRVLIWNQIPTANGTAADLVIGQAAFGDSTLPSAPTASRLNSPGSVVSDGTRLAVADGNHNRVLVWRTFPTANGQPADFVIGQPDLTTSGGTGSGPHRFNGLGGLAIVDGALLAVDSGNHRILFFDPFPTQTLANISSASQVLGQPDTLTVDPRSISASSFTAPGGITVSGDDLFVADPNNRRVLRFDLALP